MRTRGVQKCKKFEFELADKLSWLWEAIVACTKNFRSLAHLEQPPQALVDFSIMANKVKNDKIKNGHNFST